MNYLLDTDTCSAHMRRPAQLAHRFIQHTGGLAIPSIVLAELYGNGKPDSSDTGKICGPADVRPSLSGRGISIPANFSRASLGTMSRL
jgi:hypothetical protein